MTRRGIFNGCARPLVVSLITSSFKLAQMGWGYWQVLGRLWLRTVFGVGAYRGLAVRTGARQTWRSTDAEQLRALGKSERGG